MERSKHIEVCVRLRPLTVQNETSSSSFFHSNNHINQTTTANTAATATATTASPHHTGSRLRKPSIPRPGTSVTSSTRIPGIPAVRSSFSTTNGGKPTSPQSTTSEHPDTAATATPTAAAYAWDVITEDSVAQSPHTDIIPGRTHTYTLDRVYGPDTHTYQIYETSVKDLVYAAMEGYHTAVLAYGQTSTGKTHTMTGTAKQPGLIPLAVRECFTNVRASREYLLRISYLEVYKEHVRDLFAPTTDATPTPIRLFEQAGKLQIRGLREEVVTSPEQVFALLAQGEARRQVGATHFNQHSSRSHVMVRLWIESRDTTGAESVRVSSLSLVDLAGSESVRLTGNSERRAEGHYINQSLMTLGQVVYALSEAENEEKRTGKKPHVPYRDSKLTRLLQPCLSGNAQVVLLCCVSPLVSHLEESHNTFKFAIRAKKIPQKAVIQEQGEFDEKTLLQIYREEIEELKRQLHEAQEQQREQQLLSKTFSEMSAESTITRTPSLSSFADDEDIDDEVQELVEAIQNMEKLILKTQTSENQNQQQQGERSSNAFVIKNEDIDEEMLLLENVMVPVASSNRESIAVAPTMTPRLVDTTAATAISRSSSSDDLQLELARIQGLLGSVLKRRQRRTVPKSHHHPSDDEEVRNLRARLEQQEVFTSLRQADSSFLQSQLEEKDKLLVEVSKLLEAVEERQSALEAENKSLREEVERLRSSMVTFQI
jgi:centromeric protein E